jgi:putative membrane-bound dehydrogenase-like protein
MRIFSLTLLLLSCLLPQSAFGADDPLKLVFLGDNGHHRPSERFLQVEQTFLERGIQLTYADDPAKALTPEFLADYDGLVLYANIDAITKPQADALLDFVKSGRGFVPLHCATYCFRNDERIVALMGGQFQSHGGEVFSTVIAEHDHPVMQGFGGFSSWDETYIHTLHNPKDRTVLEYRVQGGQAPGNDREPWTWVRNEGEGRIFYTAWGHDERTWGNPGFQNLVERGIRWACGDDPSKAGPFINTERAPFAPLAMTPISPDAAPFEFIDVGGKIPNYTPGGQWGAQGDPLTVMQLPLTPEASLTHYSTPVGFELRPYATEASSAGAASSDEGFAQLGGKPIAMNWDERGRLWVCETMDYPNELQRGNRGRDRIRICEDTDGDGVADKFSLFAEELSIPCALLPIYGGVIVQNGTETLFLKDTDGDDQADVRQVLISGWALGDTHGGVSNFRYGLDNWVYAMQGYNNSSPTIVATGEEIPSFRQGFFRMKFSQPAVGNGGNEHVPVVEEIEFLRSTNNNTWGLGISEEGLIFGSTANHNPSDFMPIANRYYERVLGWGPEQLNGIADTYLFKAIDDQIRQVDQFGGYTAGCGHALYTARAYPKTYWNRTAFVCEPTGHLVGTFSLTADGANFKSTSPENLIASDDDWAAPIMAEVGPDGNVWVLDWYNYIIQHNPTPHGFETGRGNAYESDLRDKRHGRVYRLVSTTPTQPDTVGSGIVDLGGRDDLALVEALRDPTMLVRLQAQRLLIERNVGRESGASAELVEALGALVRDESIDSIGLNTAAIHALWTLHGLGAIESDASVRDALVGALQHSSAGVRRNAVQVLPAEAWSARLLLTSTVLGDDDAQVQLAAILALADQPDDDEAGSRLEALSRSDSPVMRDPVLADAVTSAAAAHSLSFLKAIASDTSDAESPRMQIVARIAEHLARSKPSSDEVNQLIALLADGSDQFGATMCAGLVEGWQRNHKVELTAESEAALIALLERLPAGAKGQLIQLATAWGSQELQKHTQAIVDSLLAVISDEEGDLEERVASARQLVGFRATDSETVTGLLDLITPQASPEFAAGMIASLGDSTAENLGTELLDRLPTMTPAVKETAIRVLLARPETTIAFLDGVEAGQVQLADLKLDQKTALSAHPRREIRERAKELLETSGGLPSADRVAVVEEFLALTGETGDVELGKAVYKKNCAKCHRHSGEGENIGPDLTGMAVHPKAELLIHILDPSRSVEGNFRSYTVMTVDGIVMNGMLAGESRTSIELIDTEAKKHSLARQDIELLTASNKSVMPEGFEKTVTKEDFVHLLEFLTFKGKYVPLDLRKVASSISTRAMFVNEANDAEKLIFPDWAPKMFHDVPFVLIDPKGDQVPNAVLFYGPNGKFPPNMPKSISLPLNAKVKTVHLLSGVSGWGHPYGETNGLSLIVRLHFADGTTEDHELRNGVHFADYIRRVDVPGSEFAFPLRGQQIRYIAVDADRQDAIVERVEFVKGPDDTAPVIMSATVETP